MGCLVQARVYFAFRAAVLSASCLFSNADPCHLAARLSGLVELVTSFHKFLRHQSNVALPIQGCLGFHILLTGGLQPGLSSFSSAGGCETTLLTDLAKPNGFDLLPQGVVVEY